MKKRVKVYDVIIYVVLITMSMSAVFPFLLMLASSFCSEQSLLKYGYVLIPKEISFNAYQYLFSNLATILRAYGVTIFVTIFGTAVGTSCIILLAYPLAVEGMPGRRMINFLVYFTMLFNGGLVPTYILYSNYLHMKNTIWGLICPALLMRAYYIILARSFFQTSIPGEIVEAARVDGASEFTIFFRIVRPMATPIIATVALMQGLAYWNDWTNGLYYVTDKRLYSIQQLLNQMINDIKAVQSSAFDTVMSSVNTADVPSTAVRMAIAIVAVLPVMIVYPYFQKYFIKGLTLGAVKG